MQIGSRFKTTMAIALGMMFGGGYHAPTAHRPQGFETIHISDNRGYTDVAVVPSIDITPRRHRSRSQPERRKLMRRKVVGQIHGHQEFKARCRG